MSFAAIVRQADALYEAALGLPLPQFEEFALRRLGHVVGFDGMVWGEGHLQDRSSGVAIDHAVLIDRPWALVEGYAEIASEDPIARAFLSTPHLPLAESIARPHHHRLQPQVQDFLLGFGVGHLVLCGRPMGESTIRWLTAYRQPKDPAFKARDVRLLWSLLPLWNQAWEVCRARNRVTRPRQVQSPSMASEAAGRHLPEPLTSRQTAVLQELAQGLRYAEIASRLHLSVDTVRSHVRQIYLRLGVRNRTEALIAAEAIAANGPDAAAARRSRG